MNAKRRSSPSNSDEPATKRRADVEPEPTISERNKERISAMVNNLWYLPHIINGIFQHLEWSDLQKCSHVCRAWQEEAARFFESPIDDCSIVVKDMVCELNNLRDGKHSEKCNKVLDKLDKQNLKTISDPADLFNKTPHCLWYFFYQGNDPIPFMGANVDRYLRDFLNKKSKYTPSVTFIRSDHRSSGIRKIVPSKCPTIVVQQKVSRISYKKEFQIFQTLSEAVGIPGLFETLKHNKEKKSASECVKAFQISQKASDHKVIVTDWSDSKCKKPNRYDSQYPIKAFIYLVGAGMVKGPLKIKNWLEKCSLQSSGIKLDKDSQILYNLCSDKFRLSTGLSISFCGKEVRSAIIQVNFNFPKENKKDIDKVIYEALELEREPDFPVNDGRVLGFIFEHSRGWHDALNRFFEIVSEMYPRVKFIRVHSRSIEPGYQSIRIHLVRI